jgi:ABC-2 type transport system ATP-binding protein
MAEVERLADRVVLLQAGRIIEDGTPSELIATYGRRTLEEVFLDVVRGRPPDAVDNAVVETPRAREAS